MGQLTAIEGPGGAARGGARAASHLRLVLQVFRTPVGRAEPVADLQERRVMLAAADYRRLEETRVELERRLQVLDLVAADEPQLHSVRVDR